MTTRKTASRPAIAEGIRTPVVKLSISVEPFVSVIRRHVKVSEKARLAIERDLAEVLNHAQVQLLAGVEPEPASSGRNDPIFTTEEAAQFVGVSRPYMARLIDAGDVELHQKVGNQRRVLRSAVTRWQRAERARQAKALKRLANDLDEEIFPS